MFGPLRKPSRRLARVNRQATELRRRRGRAIFREELSRARFRELPDSRLMIRPRRAEAEIRGSIKQCDGLHNIWVCEAMPGRQKNERRDRKKTAKKNAARLLLRLHPDCAYSAGNWSRSDAFQFGHLRSISKILSFSESRGWPCAVAEVATQEIRKRTRFDNWVRFIISLFR